MSKYILQTRASDTLASTMAEAATTCTLTSGNFGSPTGEQIITIDYDVAAKAADFECTIDGTAVTSMTRLNGPDVEHSALAKVSMNFVDEHYAKLTDFVGARAYLNATLGTTVDSVWTKVALDAETYDVGANFASSKFVAPVSGYYQVSWAVSYDNAVSTKLYSSGIYVDGAKVAQVDNTNSTITGLSCAGSDVIYLAAASYVELYYFQASGATTVDIFRGPEGTYMTVSLLKET